MPKLPAENVKALLKEGAKEGGGVPDLRVNPEVTDAVGAHLENVARRLGSRLAKVAKRDGRTTTLPRDVPKALTRPKPNEYEAYIDWADEAIAAFEHALREANIPRPWPERERPPRPLPAAEVA